VGDWKPLRATALIARGTQGKQITEIAITISAHFSALSIAYL
jgi:hypothetical protein